MDSTLVTLETSPTTAALDEALAKAQGEIQTASKDKNNPAFRSKYADLTSVWEACRPALAKNGICLTQWPLATSDNRLHIITRIAHKGEWMQARFSLPVDKSNAHGFGSAITYAKRFTLSAALGVVADDDDDGNAATKTPPHNDAGPRNATPPAPRNSSANGRAMAADEPHLIDHNRAKGTMPKADPEAEAFEKRKENARRWALDLIEWLDESDLTVEELNDHRDKNEKKAKFLQDHVGDVFNRYNAAFMSALKRASGDTRQVA